MAKSALIASLIELRKRLLRSLFIWLAVCIPFIFMSPTLYHTFALPLLNSVDNATLIATHVISPFTVPLKCALALSFVVVMPLFLHQIWGFISPGLYSKEKKTIKPYFLMSIILFYVGVAFAYFLVCPLALAFFNRIAPEGVRVMTDISHYLNFMLTLIIAFGLCFEVPIIVIFLIRTKIVEKKQFIRFRKYYIVLAFVIGMFLTPPRCDITSHASPPSDLTF